MAEFTWIQCRKIFLEAIFCRSRKPFSNFPPTNFHHHFTRYYRLKKITYCLSDNHNQELICAVCLILKFLHWCYTVRTGVTLIALVLELNCTAVSQSELSDFFMYIDINVIILISSLSWTN